MVSPVDSDLLSASISSQQLKSKTQQLKGLEVSAADNAKLREAVEGFEAIFIQKMWQQMRKGVPKGGMFKSREEQMWQGMYDQELAVKMSKSGGIGLSDMLYKQLSQKLGEASRTTSTQGAATLPVRELSGDDSVVKPLKQMVVAERTAEADDLYSPVEESQMVTEKVDAAVGSAVTVKVPPQIEVKTDSEFMSDSEVEKNVQALGRKIITAAPDAQVAANTVPAEVPVVPVQNLAVEESLQPATSVSAADGLEASLGVGGPLEPTPDMATINWPLPGPISSKFGWRNDPFTGKRAWHSGVDIAGKVGQPVAAAWDGKVIYSGEKKGYGNLVVVQHPNGWRSYYGHNSKLNVQVGDQIEAGKKIAEVGNTGRSTGPHLHFEVRQGELAWNPQQIRSRLMAGLPIGKMG